MTTTAELREFLNADPFVPFRLILSSGDAYEVRNPGLVVPMRSRLFLAFPNSDRWTVIPFLHIAAIETVNGNGRRSRRRK